METPEKIHEEVDLKTENKFLKDQKNKLEEQYKEMVNKYNELEIKSIKDQEALKEKCSSDRDLVLKQEQKKHRTELQKVRENANKEKKNLREEKENSKKDVVRLQKEIDDFNKKYNQDINKLQQDMLKSKDEIKMYLTELRECEKKLSECENAKSNLNIELIRLVMETPKKALKEKCSSDRDLVLKQEQKKHRTELQKVRENANKEKKNLREEKDNLKKDVVRLQKEIDDINKKYDQDMLKSKDETKMYLMELRKCEKKLSECENAKSNLNIELDSVKIYSAESETLNIREALHLFENEKISFFNDLRTEDGRRERGDIWKEFWEHQECKILLQKLNFTGDVKNTVNNLFKKLNFGVHHTYYKGKRVYIKRNSFLVDELKLIQAVWKYGEFGSKTLIFVEETGVPKQQRRASCPNHSQIALIK